MATFTVLSSAHATGSEPHLVFDLNATPSGSQPGILGRTARRTFFSAVGSSDTGRELWVTDGTAGGTVPLRDLTPGPSSTEISSSAVLGDQLYFTATAGSHGANPWVSDGTPEGTYRILDLGEGGEGAFADGYTEVDGRVFFAVHAVEGDTLWMTAGAPENTQKVDDRLFVHDSLVMLGPIGTSILFRADDGTHGNEPWVSDGTEIGTRLLLDVWDGPEPSWARYAGVVRDLVVFRAADEAIGAAVWVTDGTTPGTELLVDDPHRFNAGCASDFVRFRDELVFTMNGAFWATDGTPAGTREIRRHSLVCHPQRAFVGLDRVFLASGADFRENDHPSELWVSDGTTAGTGRLWRGPGVNGPGRLTVLGDAVYFVNADLAELWRTDGTELGTKHVLDLRRESVWPYWYYAFGMREWNGQLFFTRFDEATGTEPWTSLGSAASSRALRDISPGARSSYPLFFPMVDGPLLITAQDPLNGRELWKTEGTPETTELLMVPNRERTAGSEFAAILPFGGRVVVHAAAVDHLDESRLWVSDGTAEGTRILAEFGPIHTVEFAASAVIGSRLYLVDEKTGDIWGTDGTTAGTSRFAEDIMAGSEIVSLGDRAFFGGDDQNRGLRLWSIDRLGAVSLVADFLAYPRNLKAAAGLLFFFDSRHGKQRLWRTDGTRENTFVLLELNVPPSNQSVLSRSGSEAVVFDSGAVWRTDGTHDGTVRYFPPPNDSRTFLLSDPRPVRDQVVFKVLDEVTGLLSVWATDGTIEGTEVILEFPSSLSSPSAIEFIPFHGDTSTSPRALPFLVTPSPEAPPESWLTDGTVEGTFSLSSIQMLGDSATAVEDRIYFVASDVDHGAELWTSDGTVAGTQRCADILPGPDGAFPSRDFRVVAAACHVYFHADDGIHSTELWRFSPRGGDCPFHPGGAMYFLRSDSNDDGFVNISDPVHTLNWLFAGGLSSGCAAAADANGDGAVNISDPTYVLNHLFSGTSAPVAPFPDCGASELPSDEVLGCETPPASCQ